MSWLGAYCLFRRENGVADAVLATAQDLAGLDALQIAAEVNRGAAANCAFEAVFQAVSSFFTIDRLAAIGEKMNILLG